MSGRNARHVVHAENAFDAEALHQAVVHHGERALADFLGGLEYQHRGAGEVAGLGEMAGRAQKHHGMAVMPAGMHPAGAGRGVVRRSRLDDRQGVHVGPEPDRRTVTARAAHYADHA